MSGRTKNGIRRRYGNSGLADRCHLDMLDALTRRGFRTGSMTI